MRVGVLGIGRVGLPTAATLASMGHSVVAADIDRDRVATVARGIMPFPEPGLEELTNLEGASCGVLCTGWEEFRHLDLDRARDVMTFPVMVEGRNLFDPSKMERAGFTYLPTGRLPTIPSGSPRPTPIGLASGLHDANEEAKPTMP